MGRSGKFEKLVAAILAGKKSRYARRHVARRMGISYDVFASRLNGRTCFSADEIQSLLRYVPEAKIADYLLDGSPFMPVARSVAGKTSLVRTAQSGINRIVIDVAAIVELFDRADSDQFIDKTEKEAILQQVYAAEKAVAALRNCLEQPSAGARAALSVIK